MIWQGFNLNRNTLYHALCVSFILCGTVSTVPTAQAALSPVMAQPGSQITNIASGDYIDDEGNQQVIDSNPVSLIIQQVYALDLHSNQQQIGTLGAKINFPHILTNTGNVADSYRLSISQLTTDQYDLSGVAVYADRDQNGLPDDNVNLIGSTVQLAAGQSLSVVVAGSIPTNRNKGDTAQFTLTASSSNNTALSKSVTDTATVVDDAVILVTKSQSVSSGSGNQVLSYTFTYTNNGTAAGRVVISDILDGALTYNPGSGVWSNGSGNLTDADDTEVGANSAIKYNVKGNTVTAELASVPALSTGSIAFQVTVNNPSLATIPNSATYYQYEAGSTGTNNPTKNTATNTVVYSNQFIRNVVANVNPSASSDRGNPNQAPDNLTVVANANAGQEVLFDDYIWNTGSATDSFNLTYTGNLSSCAVVRLYSADGKTQLVDSNNDGIVDTGPIAVGSARHIKLGIITKPDCNTPQPLSVDLTATSVVDATKSNAVRNQITNVIAGTTDLYNSDQSGLGVGVVNNNGNPLVTKPLQQGQAVFALEVKNGGNSANNYNLYAAGSAINLSNPATNLPNGWQVKFFEGDATCTTLGNQITNTGSVAAGAVKHYCAVVTASTAVTNIEQPLWFAVKSPVNGQGDVIMNQVSVKPYRLFTLNADQQGQVDSGGTVVYLHTLTNRGSLTEGTAIGQVLLNVTPQNSNDKFNYTLYYDANKNGVIDATDPLASDLAAITANAGLAPNQSLQLLLKVQAPSTATNGTTSAVTLHVLPTTQLQNIDAAQVGNTDLTTVSSSQLRLTKLQVKTACTTSGLDALPYSTSAIQIKPNECVAYQLKVSNDGSNSVANVVIADTVPAYTVLQNPPAPKVSQGTVTVNAKGEIKANLGMIDAGQTASAYFLILVSP